MTGSTPAGATSRVRRAFKKVMGLVERAIVLLGVVLFVIAGLSGLG